jgi:hypothetical protein
MIGEFLRRIQYYLRRRQFEAELDEEMRHHLALKQRDSVNATAAQKQFGNVTLLKEDSRAMWAWAFGGQLLQDRDRPKLPKANMSQATISADSPSLPPPDAC